MKFLATLLLFVSLGSEANECARDAKKFCAGIEPGKGQLAKCLGDYADQLEPTCSKELKEFKSKTGKVNPCFEDLAEFCSDVPSDARKLEYCLLRNENRLSPSCSADFKKKKGNLIVRDVCAQDVVNNCYPTILEPEGAISRCLIKNRTKLTGFCQKSVDKKIADMRKANPCFDETEKYCPTQIRFHEIHECMEKKLNALSPNCKKVVQEEIKREESNPCYADLRQHCKRGLSATEQHQCLTLNEKELSNGCRQFRVNESQKLKKMVDLCEVDRLKLCPKAPFQNGMVLKCLKENVAKVTPACKTLIQ
jgi:hypothetical protein